MKKVSVLLHENDIQFLIDLANENNLTFTDILRKSISSYRFIHEHRNNILIEKDKQFYKAEFN
jgi:hypothetical protein